MMSSQKAALGLLAAACAAGPAGAQSQFLINDRNNDAIFRGRDLNADGLIADPGEVFLWFNAANAAGTLGPMNPTALGVSACRVAVMGDQGNGSVYRLADVNGDGDAQDIGESIVFIDATNAGGLSFAFPTGVAFDSNCAAYVVNAGNASGPDAIYRLVDLNADGDAQDAGEATFYVGAPFFGAGNGPFSPQEIVFGADDALYLRNSSANLMGIWRFIDVNRNGVADDAGEATVFLDNTNASGVTLSAGFAIDFDRAITRHTALYTLQTATGGVDQLIRAVDLNDDGDALDAGEAALVWSFPDAGFTGVDMVSLANGDVLVTDNSSLTIARLKDLNSDGDFLDAGETTVYYANGGTLAQVRQLDRLCVDGDVNCDGVVNVVDLLAVINGWGASNSCAPADDDCSGAVDVIDLLRVINNWG